MSVKKTTKSKGVTVKADDGNYTLTQTGAEVQADLDFAESVAAAIASATAGQALVSDGDGGVDVTDMPSGGFNGVSVTITDLYTETQWGGGILICYIDNEGLIHQVTKTRAEMEAGVTLNNVFAILNLEQTGVGGPNVISSAINAYAVLIEGPANRVYSNPVGLMYKNNISLFFTGNAILTLDYSDN